MKNPKTFGNYSSSKSKNIIEHHEIQNHTSLTPEDFLTATRPLVTFRRNPKNKFQLSLNLIVVRVDAAGNVVEEEDIVLSSDQMIVRPSTNVDDNFSQMRGKIIELIAN